MDRQTITERIQQICLRLFGCQLKDAAEKQVYRAVCCAVRELLQEKQREFEKQSHMGSQKQIYYMSMEFLVGTSLRNNLFNLGILDETRALLTRLASVLTGSVRWSRMRVSATAVSAGWPRAIWTRQRALISR